MDTNVTFAQAGKDAASERVSAAEKHAARQWEDVKQAAEDVVRKAENKVEFDKTEL
jgi:hypothetical protein